MHTLARDAHVEEGLADVANHAAGAADEDVIDVRDGKDMPGKGPDLVGVDAPFEQGTFALLVAGEDMQQ